MKNYYKAKIKNKAVIFHENIPPTIYIRVNHITRKCVVFKTIGTSAFEMYYRLTLFLILLQVVYVLSGENDQGKFI